MRLHPEYTFNFSAIYVGSFDIRVYRVFFPNEVNSPEIAKFETLGMIIASEELIFSGNIFQPDVYIAHILHRMSVRDRFLPSLPDTPN